MVEGARSLWLNPRLVLVLFLIFSSGALAGALAMRYSLRDRPEQPAGPPFLGWLHDATRLTSLSGTTTALRTVASACSR